MSTFNEVITGGLTIFGCALITFLDELRTKYGQGDIVYNVNKARLGVLEKVVVKKQRIIRNIKTHGKFIVLYFDTFNGLWNEWDLVPLSEAQLLATIYLQSLLDDLSEIETCG